ncbi:OLC1v1017407C1 [Oldenlandia corymbosa var. corymbosa]|uniref:OLC1v1017407C1 n=1 Tax=Oldenlandia corymbosa var. corymbosa TaxID=529605 RepID=A0AAV1E9B4_OLDCO|nr:OLC1v1017407C1 [Oldenlandia corymbosa var. corymbosa]
MNRIDIDIGPNYDIIALSFPFPPTISDWSIFGIFQSDDPLLRHQIILGNINSGERQSWHYKYFVNQNNIRISNGTLVYQDDQYYCLDVKGRVYAVQDPHGDNITFKYWCRPPIFKVGPSRVGAAPSRFLDTNQSFLAAGLEEDGGGIFAVIVSRDETKVSVYEFCRRECKWFPVENLRGRMLFVSETASFVAKATNPRMSNKIYFPKFYGASGVFYSLKTKKYHSYDGRFSSKESYTLQDMPSTATWIQPSLPLPEDLSFNF